jgi:hypothetical protein
MFSRELETTQNVAMGVTKAFKIWLKLAPVIVHEVPREMAQPHLVTFRNV